MMAFAKDKSHNSCFSRALWLLLFFSSLLCAATENCQSESSCILPDPQPSLDPGNLDDVWLETTCMLGCTEKYDKTSEILRRETAWPTMNFTKHDVECISFQRVRECREGCVMRHSHRYTTINRCRDLCFSACESSPPPCIEGDDCEKSYCSRSCRKTFCRFGCEVYDETRYSTASSTDLRHPPAPSVAPRISQDISVPKWQSWLHATNYESAVAAATRNSAGLRKLYAISAYLVKLNTSSQTYYIWQKDISEPLDLSPFACSEVSISFAVISKYRGQSSDEIQFSPSTTICSMGVGGYPSNVSNIQATYTEDLRESYVGYSIAKVTWTAPNDSIYLTSYSIRVYPCQLRCGGTKEVVYSYVNIDKELTSFTLQAETTNGLWRFGCSYIIEVISLPSRDPIGRTIGSYITSATELTTIFPPLELKCGRVWNEDGNFNISVEWEFPESLSVSHITRYILTPTLQSRANGILQFYNYTVVHSDGNKYYALTQMFVPQATTSNLTFVVDVNVEKNHMYYWRTIPQAKSCSVPASPLPPSPVETITISQFSYNRTTKELRTIVHVSPPANLHGLFQEYELVIANSREDCKSCAIAHGLHFWSKTTTFEINTTIDVSNTTNCLYFLVRASNHYNLSSNWLEEIAPLNSNCDAHPTTETSVLSIVYKREDGTSRSVLNLGCPTSTAGSVHGTHSSSKLKAIDFKLQDFTLRIQENSEGSHVKILSRSHLKLANIEEKINALIDVLNQESQT